MEWSRSIDAAEQGRGQTCIGPAAAIQDARHRYELPLPTRKMPLFASELKGPERLRAVAGLLFGGGHDRAGDARERAVGGRATFPDGDQRRHWSTLDPAAVAGDEATRLAAFRAARLAARGSRPCC